MRRTIAALATLILAAGGVVAVAAAPAQARAVAHVQMKDKNCSDFPNQAAAQEYFLNHGGPDSDPDGLDAEGDGVACESNPCPCNYSTHGGGGGGGGGGTHKTAHHVKVHRELVPGSTRFRAAGKVTTFKNGRIQIQRNVKHRGWKYFTSTRTKPGTGRFQAPIAAGAGRSCFRVVVPVTRTHHRTVKQFACFRP